MFAWARMGSANSAEPILTPDAQQLGHFLHIFPLNGQAPGDLSCMCPLEPVN
jgi:hypothetical protein